MGIPGLSTFLSLYHARYRETLLIRDSPVVVDGNNLMHFLLTHPRSINAHLVGGDWILYSKTTREFLQHLKSCQISAIVIFDGVLEPEKFKTKFKRLQDSIKANVNSTSPGSSYSPVAMSTVFREVLTEQGILHYQTEFECDDTLAFVAKRLECPILSSDSDFYIYPHVQNIPLSVIEFRKSILKKDKSYKTQKKVNVLSAKVLAMERLCKNEFKFTDRRFFPLAAVIMGNDRISSGTFGNVLKLKASDRSHRIKCIFEWLGRHKDYDHVLNVILQTVKENERIEILSLVKTILQNYDGDHGDLRVWNAIIQDLNLKIDLEQIPEDSSALGLPVELHIKCRIPTFIYQLLKNQFVFLQPQVEMSNLPSSHELSLDIIRTMAGILLGNETITLFTRQRKNAIGIEVNTITELPQFGTIQTIQDVKFRNKAVALFSSLFNLNESEMVFVNEWPTSLRFIVMCLIYFFKKANGWSILRPMTVAILLLYMKPSFQSCHYDGPPIQCSSSTLSDLIKHQKLTTELIDFFNRFDTTAVYTKSHPFEISFSYVCSQFQCLLVHSITLNKLLGNPFRNPKMHQLNARFIYNIIDSVFQKHQTNMDSFLELYFSRTDTTTSSILEIFNRFFAMTNNINSKGAETLTQESQRDGNVSQNSSSSDEDNLSDTEATVEDFVSNRFRKLRVQ